MYFWLQYKEQREYQGSTHQINQTAVVTIGFNADFLIFSGTRGGREKPDFIHP